MIILIIGSSGSGKDTQANLLEEKFGFVNISTGEIFRTEYELKTPAGLEAAKYWKTQGKFVPSSLVYELLSEYIKPYINKDLILNAVVRTPDQINLLDKLLKQYDKKLDKVIYLKVQDEVVIERISNRYYAPISGQIYHLIYNPPKEEGVDDVTGEKLVRRKDDEPKLVLNRLNEFKKAISPILDDYKNKGILCEIDASKSIEEVQKDIINCIGLNK